MYLPYTNNKTIGIFSERNQNKFESTSYKMMVKKAIKKRRMRNKVARKSRRLNQIRANNKPCKFYARI